MNRSVPADARELERLAALTIALLRMTRGLELSYDVNSVFTLDQWINQHRRRVSPLGIRDLGLIFGAFLGECMRRELGGVWERTREDWVIRLPHVRPDIGIRDVRVFPMNKAVRQLLDGEQQSIAVLYQLVSAMCDTELTSLDPRQRLLKRLVWQLDSWRRVRAIPTGLSPMEWVRHYLGSADTPVEEQVPDQALARLSRVREAVTRANRRAGWKEGGLN